MENKRKILAWFLAFALILGMLPALPVAAMAAETENAELVEAEAEQPADAAEDPKDAAPPEESGEDDTEEEEQANPELPAEGEAGAEDPDVSDENIQQEPETSQLPPDTQTGDEETDDEEADTPDEDTPLEDEPAPLADGEEDGSDSDGSMTQDEFQAALEEAGSSYELKKSVYLSTSMTISKTLTVGTGGELIVGGGATLTLNASAALYGDGSTLEDGTPILGALVVESGSSLRIASGASVYVNSNGYLCIQGSLISDGSIAVGSGGSFWVEGGEATINGNLTNQGALQVAFGSSKGTLNVKGTMENFGYLAVNDTGSIQILADGYLSVGGGLDCKSGSSIVVEENGALWVHEGGVATIDGSLTNQGYLQVGPYGTQGALNVNGTLENAGYLAVGNTGTLGVTGTLNHSGYADILGGTSISGTLTGAGSMTISSTVEVFSTGKLEVMSPGELRILEGGYLSAGGNLHCASGSSIVIEENGALWIQEGVAAIDGSLTNQGFLHVAPGDTDGTLNVNGKLINYCYMTLGASGALNITGRMTNHAAGETTFPQVVANGPISVSGVLINYNRVTLAPPARLEIQTDGQYVGTLAIYGDEVENAKSLVSGLDLTGYEIEEGTDDAGHYWLLRTTSQLGASTDLRWGYAYEQTWNENTGTSEWKLTAKPGNMCWRPAVLDQGRARIDLYREGEEDAVESWTWTFSSMEDSTFRSIDSFILGDYESGTYYFTVTSLGDGTNYYNSETIASETWTYIRPEAQLGSCENIAWNWPAATWMPPENSGHEVEFFFAPTEDAEPYWIGNTWGTWGSTDNMMIFDEYVQKNGNGYYYFRVRALSLDITQYQNGPWSELSEAYCLADVTNSVNGELDNILDSQTDAADIKAAVQEMDTEELKSAMLADQGDSGTIAKLAELESRVGTTVVEVTEDASGFDQSKISIVGASLNEVVNKEQDVKLIVDKPAADHVLDAQYDNSVAVSFSMGLENVEDAENLAVPVKITLPVPSSINPSFLVILHYCVDGSVEEILPYVYQDNGQYYADFVLTSFSDFVMTQKAESTNEKVTGDLTGDGIVTDADAAYLLGYTLFPEAFPVGDIDCDFNNDGTITDADAAYLLGYTLFPDAFPL